MLKRINKISLKIWSSPPKKKYWSSSETRKIKGDPKGGRRSPMEEDVVGYRYCEGRSEKWGREREGGEINTTRYA